MNKGSDLLFPKTCGATKSRFPTVVFDSFRKILQLERIENNAGVKKYYPILTQTTRST